MTTTEIFILILIFCLAILQIFFFLKIKKLNIEKYQQLKEKELLIKEINNIKVQKNQVQIDLNQLNKEIDLSKRTIEEKKEQIQYIDTSIEDKKRQIQNIVQNTYQNEIKKINNKISQYKKVTNQAANTYIDTLQKSYETAEASYRKKIASLKAEQTAAAASLNTIKETRKAAYEALLKEKQIKQNKDNYRLTPTASDLQDIHSLQNIKKSLHKPRILSMLIWQTYWQPLAKEKFPIILQDKTKTGIYKITNIETDQSYIGQSLDIYKRWSDHCKAGLGIDTPVGNKLYKAIQQYGLDSFTFEILCECSKEELNEKEKYFISLYQADTYGYNGNAGNK